MFLSKQNMNGAFQCINGLIPSYTCHHWDLKRNLNYSVRIIGLNQLQRSFLNLKKKKKLPLREEQILNWSCMCLNNFWPRCYQKKYNLTFIIPLSIRNHDYGKFSRWSLHFLKLSEWRQYFSLSVISGNISKKMWQKCN